MSWELITKENFDELEIDTGYLLSEYDFTKKEAPDKTNLICLTTGGFSISHVKTYANYGDDIDGINGTFAELEYVTGSETKISLTALSNDAKTLALALGCSTIDGEKITTVDELSEKDFKDVVWLGKKVGGGLVGARVKRTLSTGGLTLTTSKNGKGQIGIELTGFKSIANPKEVPFELYSTASVVATEE